jgi:hypothetical protein
MEMDEEEDRMGNGIEIFFWENTFCENGNNL